MEYRNPFFNIRNIPYKISNTLKFIVNRKKHEDTYFSLRIDSDQVRDGPLRAKYFPRVKDEAFSCEISRHYFQIAFMCFYDAVTMEEKLKMINSALQVSHAAPSHAQEWCRRTVAYASIMALPINKIDNIEKISYLAAEKFDSRALNIAVIHAVSWGFLELTETLINMGADPKACSDFYDKSLINIAKDRGHSSIVSLLSEKLY